MEIWLVNSSLRNIGAFLLSFSSPCCEFAPLIGLFQGSFPILPIPKKLPWHISVPLWLLARHHHHPASEGKEENQPSPALHERWGLYCLLLHLTLLISLNFCSLVAWAECIDLSAARLWRRGRSRRGRGRGWPAVVTQLELLGRAVYELGRGDSRHVFQ